MKQILSGLEHLHSRHLIHRSLSPDTIWIDELKGGKDLVRITYFDSVLIYENGLQKYNKKDFNSDLRFMAPEVIEGAYDEKMDVWSCGCIMYFMITGEYLFDGKYDNVIERNIMEENWS